MSSYNQDPYRPAGEKPVADVKGTAVAAGQDVLDSAKHEAGQVVQEAKVQGRRLLDESVGELRGQASTIQAKLADTVQALSDELGAMAASPDANGPVAQFAGTGREYGDRAAAWLRDNDLDQAVHGIRQYAARNPWTFLALAGGAGLLVGRLARGLRDADSPDAVGTYRRQALGTQETYAYDRVSETGTYPTEGELYRDADTRGNA